MTSFLGWFLPRLGVCNHNLVCIHTYSDLLYAHISVGSRYRRHEVQKRYAESIIHFTKSYDDRLAGFYIISILAGGFSAIFAYVLSLLGGKHGLAGWSWIFVSG